MHPLIEQCLTLNISKLLNEYLPAAFEEDSLVQNGLLWVSYQQKVFTTCQAGGHKKENNDMTTTQLEHRVCLIRHT